MNPSQGFVDQLFDDYKTSPGLNKSGIDQILRSPAHYIAYTLGLRSEESDSLNFGSLAHSAILEPNKFQETYFTSDHLRDIDGRTKKYKEILEGLQSERPGKQFIKWDDYQHIQGMVNSISSNETARALLEGGYKEQSAFWMDDQFPVVCKGRLDHHNLNGNIVDVKTCNDASEHAFKKSCVMYGYHRQAAFYIRGKNKIENRTDSRFIIIAIEKTPPYAIGMYRFRPEDLAMGDIEINNGLHLFNECKENNHWPDYGTNIKELSLFF